MPHLRSLSDEPSRPAKSQERVLLRGQPLFSGETLLGQFRGARTTDDLASLLRLEDDFCAVYESGAEVWIVNSLYSLSNYFYASSEGRFLHGESVHALARQGALDLDWSYETVADALAIGRPICGTPLARGATLVPQGTILHWDGVTLKQRTYRFEDFRTPTPPAAAPDRLVSLIGEALGDGAGDRPVLACSAGLDSRVNLAGLLKLGLRPELLVMGPPEATDVQIPERMARDFGLKVNNVRLRTEDYVEAASVICEATSGLKSVVDWHSYMLGSKSGYSRGQRVIMGTTGDHVRACFFDYGIVSRAVDALSRIDGRALSGHYTASYFRLKSKPELTRDELARCHPAFRAQYGTRAQTDRFLRTLPDANIGRQLSEFTMFQTRRWFQSMGLRLHSFSFQPFAPFMRKSWIDAGWDLPLEWQLGSRWHRYAVQQLFPRLMSYPEVKRVDRMRPRAGAFEWVPRTDRLFRRAPIVPYARPSEAMRDPRVLALLADNAAELDGVMPKDVVLGIVDDLRQTGRRSHLASQLLSMAVWRASIRRVKAPQVA